LELEQETEKTHNHFCTKCDYTGPSVFHYSRRNVVAIQVAQNALIAAALERARMPRMGALRVPQTPATGLGAIIGKWPGTETGAEIADGLKGAEGGAK
jgi:hypothetical protein